MPALTFSDFLTYCERISTIGGIGLVVWRIIVFLHETTESVVKTFTAIPSFMEGTTTSLKLIDQNVNTAVTNHLTHMEDGITRLAESSDRLATNVGNHIIEMAKTQAIILDRLPQ